MHKASLYSSSHAHSAKRKPAVVRKPMAAREQISIHDIAAARVEQAGGVSSLPASSLTPIEADAIVNAKMTAEGEPYNLSDLDD